ncbi:MAG: DNA-binding protein [Verrucomicrobiae bacterium]|nr:DNA-binding protein [Verrucomicrobiae bacterium]
MSGIQPQFLSETDAARFLSLSRKTLQRLRTKGGGPEFCKLGGRVVYPLESLTSWAMGRICKSTSGYARADASE